MNGDPAVAPQQKPTTGGGENSAALADSPYGSQFAPFYGPLNGEKILLHRMSEFLHSLPFHHCIDSFPPFKLQPASLRLYKVFTAKHVWSVFRFLKN